MSGSVVSGSISCNSDRRGGSSWPLSTVVESSDGDECIVVVVGGVFLTSIFFLGGVVPLTSDMLSSTVPCSSTLSDCIIVSRYSLFRLSVDVVRFVRIGGVGSGGGLVLRVGRTVASIVACVLVVE